MKQATNYVIVSDIALCYYSSKLFNKEYSGTHLVHPGSKFQCELKVQTSSEETLPSTQRKYKRHICLAHNQVLGKYIPNNKNWPTPLALSQQHLLVWTLMLKNHFSKSQEIANATNEISKYMNITTSGKCYKCQSEKCFLFDLSTEQWEDIICKHDLEIAIK